MGSTTEKKLTVPVAEDLHRAVRIAAIRRKTTLKAAVTEALRAWIEAANEDE